ncbi:hypothetical protein [Enteractinococcus helveticum]|uniref:DNA-binding protein n=1 Tax=Enteractinococcus helveticum TaxID=1837282 RepID=A0A1B7M2M5_9MICC|nr:hypothetical protein [Enteractinococcus helveticum]OAV62857.1 hypothetical protein A6F49_04140 [Enteractinococcus helveticum]
METWYISIGFRTTRPFSDDLAFDMSERLEDFAAVMSMARDRKSGSAALTVDAKNWSAALDLAHTAVIEVLEIAEAEATITAVGAQNQDEFHDELNEPVYPKVVGFAEIARIAGVSRQRARQLAEKDSFPDPVIKTSQGPLYNIHVVQRWLESRANQSPSAQANTA